MKNNNKIIENTAKKRQKTRRKKNTRDLIFLELSECVTTFLK